MPSSIFFEFTLPNSASWFYFSLFLTVAMFFQFTRVLSLRNLDLLALFLFAPGFLIVQEANQAATTAQPPAAPPGSADRFDAAPPPASRERFVGYAWLLAASGWWFVRCLLDSAAAKRPLPAPNLTPPAMAWFGCSLFVCLAAVTFTRPADPWEPVGRRPAAISGVEDGATAVVQQTQPAGTPVAQVRSWVRRALAAGGHVAVVVGLVLTGWRYFGSPATGAAAGTLYLLLPYTAYHAGQAHHVWPAALVLWAAFAFRRPTVAGGLLGLAAGTSFFPVLLLPAWVQFYRGRGVWRFLGGFAGAAAAGLAVTLGMVAVNGSADGVWPVLSSADWRPWGVPTADSVWTGAHWAYRLPVFVLYAAFVLTTFVWPPVRNAGELLATSAAVLIGVQFWYADRGGLYVLWYAPLLVLVVLRPTASDLQPGTPGPWPAAVRRAAAWAGRRLVARRPDPDAGPVVAV